MPARRNGSPSWTSISPTATRPRASRSTATPWRRRWSQVLKQCGDDLTRANVMKQAASLKNLKLPMLLPGIKINTSDDGLLSDQADADAEVQRRALGAVRPDHERQARGADVRRTSSPGRRTLLVPPQLAGEGKVGAMQAPLPQGGGAFAYDLCGLIQRAASENAERRSRPGTARTRCRRPRARRPRPTRSTRTLPRRSQSARRSGGGGSSAASPACGTRTGCRWRRPRPPGCRAPQTSAP